MGDGSFHLLSAADAQGSRHTVQVRAWRGFYPVGAFGALGALLNDQEGGNLNSILSWSPLHGPTTIRSPQDGASGWGERTSSLRTTGQYSTILGPRLPPWWWI